MLDAGAGTAYWRPSTFVKLFASGLGTTEEIGDGLDRLDVSGLPDEADAAVAELPVTACVLEEAASAATGIEKIMASATNNPPDTR